MQNKAGEPTKIFVDISAKAQIRDRLASALR
jgi:hypothetical protein